MVNSFAEMYLHSDKDDSHNTSGPNLSTQYGSEFGRKTKQYIGLIMGHDIYSTQVKCTMADKTQKLQWDLYPVDKSNSSLSSHNNALHVFWKENKRIGFFRRLCLWTSQTLCERCCVRNNLLSLLLLFRKLSLRSSHSLPANLLPADTCSQRFNSLTSCDLEDQFLPSLN